MQTNSELLKSLRDGFEDLEVFDSSGLKALLNHAQMLIRRIFGDDSPYIEQLSSIQFSVAMPIAVSSNPTLNAKSAEQRKHARRKRWLSGQREALSLIDTMLEHLRLDEAEQVQGRGGATPLASDRVFVVHGHDNEMKQAVARTIEKIGLEAVILHEKPNLGLAIIEKIERYSNVGFAVVLLSPDDIGYSRTGGQNTAKGRARQNVIFELGYFAGKLGRERVMALHRGEIELPSDYDGVLYTPYDGDSGTWRSELVAELKESGYSVSADNL